MKVIDSSFWVEFFTGTKNGSKINKFLNNENEILVPTIVITEIYKKFLNDSTVEIAAAILRKLSSFQIVALDFELSVLSATFGIKFNLPIADSIIYATTINKNATLYTLDNHFKGLKNVEYFEKV